MMATKTSKNVSQDIKIEPEDDCEDDSNSKSGSNDSGSDEEVNEESKSKPKRSSNARIRIDMNAIPCIANEEQHDELRLLNVTAYDQSVYEEGVLMQVDEAMREKSDGGQKETHADLLVRQIGSSGQESSDHEKIELLKSIKREREEQSCDETLQSKDAPASSSSVQPDVDEQKHEVLQISDDENVSNEDLSHDYNSDNSEDEWKPSRDDADDSDDEDDCEQLFLDEDDSKDSHMSDDNNNSKRKAKGKGGSKENKKKRIEGDDYEVTDLVDKRSYKTIDDGNEKHFVKRLKEYKRQRLIERQDNIGPDGVEYKDLDRMIQLDGDFQVPASIWDKLYDYQQAAVRWLWELHQHGCGGIIGDEMGLGKTIQIIAFLAGLSCSRFNNFRDRFKSLGPVLIVCPATVMHQWVAEFHLWWPRLRVAVLHQTGSFNGKKENLIRSIMRTNGVVITSFTSVSIYQKQLHNYDWHYIILDEGHKIRNPDAQVTLACKMFRTPYRLILSGSPIQNNLKELWSLFDFIYPGKLGTLPVFMEHFAVPITQGGYANASKVQIQIAYKCATVLRDTIKPYLLRRMKDDVKATLDLPGKNEQVLFCKLTDEQRTLYREYINSQTVKDIMRGSTQIFVGLINLRKICNHPDILTGSSETTENYGYYKRSGKMLVVEALLRLWFKQGHKVLLFTQGVKMIKIIRDFVEERQYSYLIMDGQTPVEKRQSMVNEFNENANLFLFLLTTRVGGIGVNLIGANRVIIFDPDWNPSTDVQARERCWRIGQNREVTIYRLLCAGTIEEKIYHRQIFKQYLTNRVLKDPKQKRFFKSNDLHELFTLGCDSNNTETSALFSHTGSNVKVKKKKKQKEQLKAIDQVPSDQLPSKAVTDTASCSNIQLSSEKVEELRQRAKEISKMISEKFSSKSKPKDDKQPNQNQNEKPSCSSIPSACPSSSKSSSSSHKNTSINHKNNSTKKIKKGVKFEGKRIKYLVKQDAYKDMAQLEQTKSEQDDYVLRKLFKKSKVHSAIQHDVIESPANHDYQIVENEAEKVAKDAIAALKRSREMCSSASSGIPTWTGSRATSRTQSSKLKNKFGTKTVSDGVNESPSSSSLMSQIRKRNNLGPEKSGASSSREHNNFDLSDEHGELLSDIRNYIAFQSKSRNGEATTQELLDKFQSKLAPHQSAVFKAMLWQICDFHRNSDKVGVWRLKTEFR